MPDEQTEETTEQPAAEPETALDQPETTEQPASRGHVEDPSVQPIVSPRFPRQRR